MAAKSVWCDGEPALFHLEPGVPMGMCWQEPKHTNGKPVLRFVFLVPNHICSIPSHVPAKAISIVVMS